MSVNHTLTLYTISIQESFVCMYMYLCVCISWYTMVLVYRGSILSFVLSSCSVWYGDYDWSVHCLCDDWDVRPSL